MWWSPPLHLTSGISLRPCPPVVFLLVFVPAQTFRRDANTQPQLGRAAARSKYQRCAWVTTTAMGDGILWEAPPAGMRTYGTAATANPPSPLPYPGTVPRLPTQQHPQHLQGFFGNGSGGFGIWGSAVRGRDEHQPGCLATANDWCEVVQVGTQLGGDGAGVDMKEPVF
ncbi:hypothetical protein Vretifemale_1110 [Volvox reticuliferus]|uniref:Uncharacterized protein n=1 Tax=Volvox reticuliferus TaxID=1737510 RepID=A0A8J4BX69_9CHLO|nr:hypothetical protein Vretifemale_1110 [Volvox reticuliferus]